MALTLAAVVAATSAAASTFAAGGSWTQMGGNPGLTRTNPAERVLSPTNDTRLSEAWSAPIGSVRSSPLVRDGRAPTVSGRDAFLSSGELLARMTSGGRVVWRRTLEWESYEAPAPAVAGSGVYTAANGRFQTFDRRTGRRLLSLPIPGEMAEALAVTNGRVYLLIATDNTGKPHLCVLQARNARTGAVVWTKTLGGSKYLSSDLMLAVGGGTVYAAAANGTLYAVAAGTGRIRWQVGLEPSPSAPLLANGVVYVVDGGGKLTAVAARSGRRIWSAPVGASGSSSAPIVAGGAVIVGGTAGVHLFRLP